MGQLNRRDLMKMAFAMGLGTSASGWFPAFADEAAAQKTRKRSCILLWMNGGPSQLDTFDPKPGHANAGPVKAIETSVPGIQISEYLPQMAKIMEHFAVIRSLSTKEGDHGRASFLVRTGYLQQGPVKYPSIGSLVGKELGVLESELPNYISISPYQFLSPESFGPGFLGPMHAPLEVGGGAESLGRVDYENVLKVKNLVAKGTPEQKTSRLDLLKGLEEEFALSRPGHVTTSHQSAYHAAVRMMTSDATKAFNLEEEPAEIRDRYGKNQFGQGCLLARRLVERGVPCVEVALNGVPGTQSFGWDTHTGNFEAVKSLCGVLDPAWATLVSDLKDRGLLETTTIVWMGEFGRTPKINQSTGRDHYPNAWSAVLGGGGIKGGQVYGTTTDDGMRVNDRAVDIPNVLRTMCMALGIDPDNQNISNVGRPIRVVSPDSTSIAEVLS